MSSDSSSSRARSGKTPSPKRQKTRGEVCRNMTDKIEDEDGVLNMENYGKVPPQVFEITEEQRKAATMQNPDGFTFQRSAKKSIMLGLGIAPGTGEAAGDPLDAYSKMSDAACIMCYMSVIVGAGTFSLSQAVAMVGWFQGYVIFFALAAWNYALAYLVVGLPQMVECNYETFAGMGRAFLGPRAGNVFFVLSILCWWSACAFQLFSLQHNLGIVVCFWSSNYDPNREPPEPPLVVKLLCLLPAVAFIFKTRGNQLVKVATVAVRVMLLVAAIEVVSALWHCLFARDKVDLVPWRSSLSPNLPSELQGRDIRVGFTGAVKQMIFAYAGVGLWPYIVADMLHPQNALSVIRRTSFRISMLYGAVGISCYLGWGDALLTASPFNKMMQIGLGYQVGASTIAVLFSVKAVCSYPLMFRPLLRELEFFLHWEELPPVELRLPWALRLMQRAKLAIRVALALLTVALPHVMGSGDSLKASNNLFVVIFCTVQLLAPAYFIAKSIRLHGENRQRNSNTFVEMHRKYLGGSWRAHTVIGMIVAVSTGFIAVYCIVEALFEIFMGFLSHYRG